MLLPNIWSDRVSKIVLRYPTSVRDIDPDLWRQLRAAALMQGVTVGELLNQIIREWLARVARE
jgi:hypothetical protein